MRNNLNRLANFNLEKKDGENILTKKDGRRSESIEVDEECVVCLGGLEFDGTQDIVITSCGHCFHKGCIGGWLSRSAHRDCPFCKTYLMDKTCDLLISETTYNQARNNNGHQNGNGHQHIHNNQMLNQNPMLNRNNNPFFLNNFFNNMQNNLNNMRAAFTPQYVRTPRVYQAIPNIFQYCLEGNIGDQLAGIILAMVEKHMFNPNLLNKNQILDNYFKKLPLNNGILSRHIHAQCAFCLRACWNNDVNSTYIITSCHHAFHPQCLKEHMRRLGLNRNAVACPCPLCGGTILPQGYAVLKDAGQKLAQWVQSLRDTNINAARHNHH